MSTVAYFPYLTQWDHEPDYRGGEILKYWPAELLTCSNDLQQTREAMAAYGVRFRALLAATPIELRATRLERVP